MKYIFLSFFCISLLLSFFLSCTGQSKWYKLFPDERYEIDFALKAGHTKCVTIESNTKIWVGFRTNINHEQFKEYMLKEIYPVDIKLVISDKSMPTPHSHTTRLFGINGGSTVFEPVDKKIVLEVSNVSLNNFKIVIYTKKYK